MTWMNQMICQIVVLQNEMNLIERIIMRKADREKFEWDCRKRVG